MLFRSVSQSRSVSQCFPVTIEQEHQNDKYRQTLEYYLDEGYPQELAEELASAEVKVDEEL